MIELCECLCETSPLLSKRKSTVAYRRNAHLKTSRFYWSVIFILVSLRCVILRKSIKDTFILEKTESRKYGSNLLGFCQFSAIEHRLCEWKQLIAEVRESEKFFECDCFDAWCHDKWDGVELENRIKMLVDSGQRSFLTGRPKC